MRGLKKTAHDGAARQTDRCTFRGTQRLLDQLGPEGRVGENQKHSLVQELFGGFTTCRADFPTLQAYDLKCFGF